MDIKQGIIDNVIYGGNFEAIRGLIAELDHTQGASIEGNIVREDFTGATFWSADGDNFEVAYSTDVMVMNKNGKLHGVAKYDANVIPTCHESQFTLGGGAISLVEGML